LKNKPFKPKLHQRVMLENAHRVMNNVIHRVAEDFRDEVRANAKNEDVVYKDDISLKQIDQNTFAVVVSEHKEKIKNLGSALIQYLPLTANAKGLASILSKYGPYPVSLLPYRHNPQEFRLVYKKVSVKEADLINTTLYAEGFRKVREALTNAKVPSSKILSQGAFENSEWAEEMAWEDLAFNTIRSELGMRTQKVPVWKPAIESFRAGDLLPYREESDKMQSEEKMQEDSSSFDRFQKAILR